MQKSAMNILNNAQQGVALFTALIFLVVITLLSLTAMRQSTMELTMSNNQQRNAEAQQMAQSAIDAVLSYDNFLVTTEGKTICYTGDPTDTFTDNCTAADTRYFDATIVSGIDISTTVDITLISTTGTFTCRTCEDSADFGGALFNITSKYDATGLGGGYAEIVQGFVRRTSKAGS